jgi:hypothetical protein
MTTKVLCFYRAKKRFFGRTEVFPGAKMIEVASGKDVLTGFHKAMIDEATKLFPAHKYSIDSWELTGYLPENFTATF